MNKLLSLAIVLLIFSYPVTTVLLTQVGQASSQVNMVIKACISSMFFASLLLRSTKSILLLRSTIPLLAFLAIYGARLLYDVLILDVLHIFLTKFYVLSYFFGLTLLPVLAISLCSFHEDVRRLHRWMFIGLIAANLALLFYVLAIGGLSDEAAFSGRVQIEGELEGTAILNPIIVGMMGAVLSVFTIGRLAVLTSYTPNQQIFHALLLLLGGANLLLGASRGPALAFGICFLIILYSLVRNELGRNKLPFRRILWFYAGLVLLIITFLATTEILSIQLFDRFALMFEDRITGGFEERDIIFELAWGDFLSSPIYGFSYVTTGGYSPHNFVLEALMSTGLIGGLILVIAMYWGFRGTLNMLRGSAGPWGYSVALAGICFFIVGLTSGSISQYPELWIFLALMTVLGNRHQGMASRNTAPSQIRASQGSFSR